MMLAALAKRYEMHPEVANTIFLSWYFTVVITDIIRSNSLIQVESVAEPPTIVDRHGFALCFHPTRKTMNHIPLICVLPAMFPCK